MSEEFQKTMYDSFSRASDSHINKIQGTGLGLAIVKQMVDRMDGIVECQSAEGEGTTFTVKIPLPTAAESDMPKWEVRWTMTAARVTLPVRICWWPRTMTSTGRSSRRC